MRTLAASVLLGITAAAPASAQCPALHTLYRACSAYDAAFDQALPLVEACEVRLPARIDLASMCPALVAGARAKIEADAIMRALAANIEAFNRAKEENGQ